MKIEREIWRILLIAIFIIGMASAQIDTKILQDDSNIKLVVKNTGNNPVYLLNSLEILNDKGNTIYTSQDKSSDILKIFPGVSYTFQWNTDEAEPGTYQTKIYQGESNLLEPTTNTFNVRFPIIPIIDRVSFTTKKMFYSYGEPVDITFRNLGTRTVYINVNNWKVTNADTGTLAATVSYDCGDGYGYACADAFEPFGRLAKFTQQWDQKDDNGNQVSPGKYKVTAEYTYDSSGSGISEISTRTFTVRVPRRR